MKILNITLEYPPDVGGIATYNFNLAAHLPPKEMVIYAPETIGGAGFDARHPWKTYRCRPYWKFIWPRWLRLFFQVWKIVKEERIEQIYVHHALPSGYAAKIIKKFKKIPFTIFFHGTDLELGLKFKKRKLSSICREAREIVVNSVFLKEKLLANFKNISPEKIKILYPGPADVFFTAVPEEKIKFLKSQLALGGKKVILTVARLEEGKGFPHILNILPQILRQTPNLVWIIVGEGKKKEIIMEQMRKANLQNVVRFVGQVPNEDLPIFYRTADLFVLLTHKDENIEEGWGTVFLEAAASGLAVVAGRAGGVEEVVVDGVTGIVTDVNQRKQTADKIIELLKNPQIAANLGINGRERARREFRWETQVAKLKF